MLVVLPTRLSLCAALGPGSVWNDIGRLLATQSEFETIARRNKFTAQLVHEPRGIKVTAAGKIYLIPYDALQSFWQQLRVHGFSMRNIAPSIDRSIAYIIPIFARLNYVSPVNVAEDYNSPQSFSTIGLQVLPSAFSRVTHTSGDAEQLPLLG